MPSAPLQLPTSRDADALANAFIEWAAANGQQLYPHQLEALLAILTGSHVVIATPTGSGKSLVAAAAHFATLAAGGRSWYTAPVKALVNEKFFSLAEIFGADNVGLITGDAAVNPNAPIICCTAEILAVRALRTSPDHDSEADEPAEMSVVFDEFHYIADPDRGWAWQVSLTELPQAQMVIMSATLGDVRDLVAALEQRTGRSAEVITDAERPVPLVYEWSRTPLQAALESLVREQRAPVYVVHSTQADANQRAQGLLSASLTTPEERRAIGDALRGVTFSPGFGRQLATLLRAGIGVHHAGMLPRYRRLVERLAQRGLIRVVCGTDTLGVGVNLPIRTVLFTSLTKFDGRRVRILKAREFHQIAGRAGRPGFDVVGYVIAQAPEHVIESEIALAKAGRDAGARKRVRRKAAPEGFVNYTEATFERLQSSPPETLRPRLRMTYALLLNLLQRDSDTVADLVDLVDASHPDAATRRRLLRRAAQLGRSLISAGVVVRLPTPTPSGRRYALAAGLQDDFALNQPLSAFAMAAIDLLDPASPTYALDVVSVIEATLENPMPVLLAQQSRARGEAVAEMKADGLEYEERRELVSEVSWPKPLEELLEHAWRIFLPRHPWIAESELSPKSVVREMVEQAMTFGEYVAYQKVQRSEGGLLRYLSEAYRALRQTVPETARTEEFSDLIEWLGEVVRMTDSSLLNDWEALAHPQERRPASAEEDVQRPTANLRAFRVLVRNAMFRRVQLASRDDVEGLAALEATNPAPAEGPPPMDVDAWDAALGDYFAEHPSLPDGPDARSPALFEITETTPRLWRVRQVIDDPAGNHDWAITATVDLDACDEADTLVVTTLSFARLD